MNIRPRFEELLLRLSGDRPPPLSSVKAWLETQEMNSDERAAVETEIARVYGLHSEEEIATALSPISTPYVDDFSDLLDEYSVGGWIRDYVEHTRNMEAPTPFHFATAITVLGAALRRRTFVDQGYYHIYPPIQALLVGPSGKVKKSTAATYGIELAQSLENDLFNVLPDEGSGEALKTELAQTSRKEGAATGLLFVSELATFIGKQEYNVNLVQTLTDLFDSRAAKRRRTQTRGNERMENIALSFLGCSNEDWLGDALPHSAFGGGFFGRMLVFYQPDTDRSFPRPRPQNPDEKIRLATELARARFVSGEAILTNEADREYERIYYEIKRDWPEDERLVPFWERFGDHVLRLGMLLSISRDLNQTSGVRVERQDIRAAEAVVRWIVRYLPGVYESVGTTQYGRDHARIYTTIRRNGGRMSDAELSKRMSRYISRKALDEHLEHMRKNGIVKRVQLDPWDGKVGWELIGRM